MDADLILQVVIRRSRSASFPVMRLALFRSAFNSSAVPHAVPTVPGRGKVGGSEDRVSGQGVLLYAQPYGRGPCVPDRATKRTRADGPPTSGYSARCYRPTPVTSRRL
jgi:hypothetical protein